MSDSRIWDLNERIGDSEIHARAAGVCTAWYYLVSRVSLSYINLIYTMREPSLAL